LTLYKRFGLFGLCDRDDGPLVFSAFQGIKTLREETGVTSFKKSPHGIRMIFDALDGTTSRRKTMAQTAALDLRKGFPAWAGALLGAVATAIYGVAGFFFLKLPGGQQMGSVLFLMLPFVVGATMGLVTPRAIFSSVLLAGTVSLLICLGTLIAMHAEGILCSVLAFPLIFVPLAIGAGLGLLLRQLISPFASVTTNCVILLIAPALLFGGHRAELKNFGPPRTQRVTTTMHLAAKPGEVWARIQSLDSLAGRKPFLMHIGLPIPQKCVLQGTSVGSKRICYFDQGSIEESVLEWDPPRKMRLAIDRTNMPGRHWLEFDGAEYDLAGDATGTTITRTTTILSNLRPAWYWARFEKWGVESEHEYLFSDLATRFPGASQRADSSSTGGAASGGSAGSLATIGR
jgi:Polyketide cyclase / dehydrase and lipid transport